MIGVHLAFRSIATRFEGGAYLLCRMRVGGERERTLFVNCSAERKAKPLREKFIFSFIDPNQAIIIWVSYDVSEIMIKQFKISFLN